MTIKNTPESYEMASNELDKIAQTDAKRVTDRLFRKLFLLAMIQVS
jgi:hypothetical protein